MSEHEKLEQIGALVEEVSHLKGKLAHVRERLTRAQQAYAYAGPNFQQIYLHNGELALRTPRPAGAPNVLDGLLDKRQLHEAISEQEKLNEEIKAIENRLQPLAPHLFQR